MQNRRPHPMAPVPSPDEILAARTPAGGWTRKQLAEWRVPWPPPKGWRLALETAHRNGTPFAGVDFTRRIWGKRRRAAASTG